MSDAQIKAVRTEYLRLSDEATKSGNHAASQAFEQAAEILLQALLAAGREARVAARKFLEARQPATA